MEGGPEEANRKNLKNLMLNCQILCCVFGGGMVSCFSGTEMRKMRRMDSRMWFVRWRRKIDQKYYLLNFIFHLQLSFLLLFLSNRTFASFFFKHCSKFFGY